MFGSTCSVPAGVIVYCTGPTGSLPLTYLTVHDSTTVIMRPFTQAGFQNAGTPSAQIWATWGDWCTTESVLNCPISDTVVPGKLVPKFMCASQLTPISHATNYHCAFVQNSQNILFHLFHTILHGT